MINRISRLKKDLFSDDYNKRYFLGSLISGVGSLLGSAFGGGSDDAGADDVKRALAYLEGQPNYEYLQGVTPTYYGTPEEVIAQTIADSPEFRQKQVTGIDDLQRLAKEGYDAESIANFNKLRNQAATEARGRNEAINREMQSRGMGGGGLELLSKLVSEQRAADALSQSQMAQAASNAAQKQLANEAMIRYSGNLRKQDTDLNKSNADILNEFNMYNSANRQAIKNANIDKLNAYNQAETAERRNINRGNVDLARNTAQDKANLALGQAGTSRQQAAAQTGQMRDIFGTIGSTAGSIYNEYQDNQRRKENQDFLKSLFGG